MHSPEEIELLIAESRDGGLLEPEEQVRLHRAFDSACEPRASSWCRGSGWLVDAAMPFGEVVRSSRRARTAGSPSTGGTPDNVIGVLHTRDLAIRSCGRIRCVDDAAAAAVVRVPDDDAGRSPAGVPAGAPHHQALVTDATGDRRAHHARGRCRELLGGVGDEFKAPPKAASEARR